MEKIVDDFTGNESQEVVADRLQTILAFWDYSGDGNSGNIRAFVNSLLTARSLAPIGSEELAGEFLSKLNAINVKAVSASGGTETVIEQAGEFYRVHTFLESGNLTVTRSGEVEYLVVAGGGAGGSRIGSSGGGGGGGAGGFRLLSKLISPDTYPVVVGSGGPGVTGDPGELGQPSSVFGDVAAGGGGGGRRSGNATNGGSGGGAGNGGAAGLGNIPETDPPQGNDGGGGPTGNNAFGWGGGGAGSGVTNRNGGAGVYVEWADLVGFGDNGYFAGGGGAAGSSGGIGGGGDGGAFSDGEGLTGGQPNTGGGGGGSSGDNFTSGPGGSGIVIIRYPITEAEYNAEVA